MSREALTAQADPDADRLARERDAHNKIFGEHTRESADRFYRIIHRSRELFEGLIMSRSPGAHALEYGCGMGRHAPNIARRGAARVVGIDISDVAIERAREAAVRDGLSRVEYHVMNAEALQFPDASFDLICGTAILHHLDLARACAEIARVLRPNGLAIFMEPLGHNPLINLYRRLTPRLRTVDEHPLRMSDFDVARRYFGAVTPHFFVLHSLAAVPLYGTAAFPKVLYTLEAADAALFRAVPFTRRYAWQVVLTLEKPQRPTA